VHQVGYLPGIYKMHGQSNVKKKKTVIFVFIFKEIFAASWKLANPVRRLSGLIVMSPELLELRIFLLNC
jgi:hypothetical protein